MRNNTRNIMVGVACLLFLKPAQSEIKKVTLIVNFGVAYIIHDGAVQSFIEMMNAMKNEKQFALTIMQGTDPSAKHNADMAEIKNQDVLLFANIGQNSFPNLQDQATIQKYFEGGGKGIGYHASIDHHQYWSWWEKLHSNCGFEGHDSKPFTLNVDPEMSKLPILKKMWDEAGLGNPDIAATEIYTLNAYPRGRDSVTMMQVVAPPNNVRPNHDFTWDRKIGKGEYIFTCLGHGPGDFTGGWLKKATWAWMEYLNGKYNVSSEIKVRKELKPNSINFEGNVLAVSSSKPYFLKISNLKGQTVLSKASKNLDNFDLTGFKPGYYFLNIKGSSLNQSSRIFVK